MNIHPFLQTLITITTLFLITFALAEGIKNSNLLGTMLAVGSMTALGVCIHLARKVVQPHKEDEPPVF